MRELSKLFGEFNYGDKLLKPKIDNSFKLNKISFVDSVNIATIDLIFKKSEEKIRNYFNYGTKSKRNKTGN